MANRTVQIWLDTNRNQWLADYVTAGGQIREAARRLYGTYVLPLGYDGRTSPERMLEVANASPLSEHVDYELRDKAAQQ